MNLKRAYEPPNRSDGYRVLVDRLWPRGISKEQLHLDLWIKEAAPSTALRKWFGHDPSKWTEFKRRYFRELDRCRGALQPILDLLSRSRVTLLYGARDARFNHAVALKEYIEEVGMKESSGSKRRLRTRPESIPPPPH
jgi:uncharacterized protein YeaO (DUF488 family)